MIFSGFKEYLNHIKHKTPHLSSKLDQCFTTLRLCFNCREVINFDTFTGEKRTIEENLKRWITPNIKIYCNKCFNNLSLQSHTIQYHYNKDFINLEKKLTECGKKKRKCSLCGSSISFYYYDGILLGAFLNRYQSKKDKFQIENIINYWNDLFRDICCRHCLCQNEIIHKLRSEFRFCFNCEKTIPFKKYFNLQLYLGETIKKIFKTWKNTNTNFLCNICI